MRQITYRRDDSGVQVPIVRLPLSLAAAALAAALLILAACAPRAITGPAAVLLPGCLYEVRLADARRRPKVALTIDDAPDPRTTPAVLDSLRRYGARATFFVIASQVDSATAPLLARVRRDGHELGHHGTRDRAAFFLDSAAFADDVLRADSILRPFGVSKWARPGSGWYSGRMVRAYRRAGYSCALGSVYPLDAQLDWPWLSTRYILAHVRPGAVIILHDRGERGERTATILGGVLAELDRRGYEVVTLTELVTASR